MRLNLVQGRRNVVDYRLTNTQIKFKNPRIKILSNLSFCFWHLIHDYLRTRFLLKKKKKKKKGKKISRVFASNRFSSRNEACIFARANVFKEFPLDVFGRYANILRLLRV